MPITAFKVFPKDENQWQRYLRECIVEADTVAEFTVAQLATVPRQKRLAFVTNETGGEVLAFRDSAGVWRRCTDRAVCS